MHSLEIESQTRPSKVSDQIQTLQDSLNYLTQENQLLNTRLKDLGLPISTDTVSEPTPLKTFAETFTGHGLRQIYFKNSKLERFVWLLFIVISVIFCSFYIYNSFNDFFAYDVISNIRVQYESTLVFPAFIVCAWGSEFNVTKAIFDCKFNGKDCQIDKMFSQVKVIGKGTTSKRYCIRFNGKINSSSELLTVNKIGYDYGLSVSFLVPDKIRLLYGIYHSNILIRSDEIFTTPVRGEGMIVLFRKTTTDKLGEPFNKCIDDPSSLDYTIIKEILSMGSEYRQNFCQRVCSVRYFESICNCSLAGQLGTGLDTCDTKCVENVRDRFDEQLECNFCPLECDSVQYDFFKESRRINDTTSTLFSSILTQANLNKNKEFENYSLSTVADKLVAFKINYDSLSYTHLAELPKTTFTNLVADFGGTIGLFLGVSFVSFFEILELIYRIATDRLQIRKKVSPQAS